MTREIAHQKMFEAALDAIMQNFPPGKLQDDPTFAHAYFDDSQEKGKRAPEGFELVKSSPWGFKLHKPEEFSDTAPSLDPRPATESKSSAAEDASEKIKKGNARQ
jgi:Mn-containing catalase